MQWTISPARSRRSLAAAVLIVLAAGSLTIAGLYGIQVLSSAQHHQAGPTARVFPLASVGQSYPYDEQVGVTFVQDFTSLAFNVTAVAQSDGGSGPAYLLNGLTDQGYWYQVGVSYKWPNPNGGAQPGFSMAYEVFSPYYFSCSGSIFPANPPRGCAGGGIATISVNPGDIVQLSLSFVGGNVVMRDTDWNSSSTMSENYNAFGASYFVGLPDSVSDSSHFFTGLMTEEYHSAPYYGSGEPVVYQANGVQLSSAWMWLDEFDPNTNTAIFANQTSSPVPASSSTSFQYFSSDGTAEILGGSGLVTGLSPITFPSFSPIVSPAYRGLEAPIALNVLDPSGLAISIESLVIRASFGIYNITTPNVPQVIQGNSTFNTKIMIPSNLTSGNYTLTIVVAYEFGYPPVTDWISAQSISLNSTILVSASSVPSTNPPSTTPRPKSPPIPGQTRASQPFAIQNLLSAAGQILLPVLLSEVILSIAIFIVIAQRRTHKSTTPTLFSSACQTCSGLVTTNMTYCPSCGTALPPQPVSSSSELTNGSLGQPSQ